MKKIAYGKDKLVEDQLASEADREEFKEKIRSRLGDLDTIPFVYRKLLSILNSPFVSARDLGKVISTDQSLSLRVLRMVNSAYYGISSKVMSVTQAVSMLGLNVVRSLCFCLASYDSFYAGTGSDQAKVWRRSMGTGLAAKNLARIVGMKCPEELFVAGMLHDIGNSVLRKFAPREHRVLTEKLLEAKDPIEALEIERGFLGTDRAEIGAMTCEAWKLPELLVACVENLYEPEKAGKHQKAVTLVAIARRGWDNHENGTDEWNEQHLESAGLTPAEVMEAVQVAETEFKELGDYVGLKSRAS